MGSLSQMSQIMEKYDESAWTKVEIPSVAVIQGQYDRVCDPANSVNFYEQVKSKDKEIWWYPNMWNNCLYEKEYPEIEKRLVYQSTFAKFPV